MAGRKHHLSSNGNLPTPNMQGKEILERDYAFRSMMATLYCKHCGGQILFSTDTQWQNESATSAHENCSRTWIENERVRIAKEEREAKDIDWDSYIEETMRNRNRDDN